MCALSFVLVGSEEFVQNPPLIEIEGVPAIRQYSILNNKRHILTKDTKGNVQLYDALMVRKNGGLA